MVPPNHPFLTAVFHYKPSILGYSYFWKHTYGFCKHGHHVASLRLSSRPPHCCLLTVGCKDLHPGNVMVKSWSQMTMNCDLKSSRSLNSRDDLEYNELIRIRIYILYIHIYIYNSLNILWQIFAAITLLLYMSVIFWYPKRHLSMSRLQGDSSSRGVEENDGFTDFP